MKTFQSNRFPLDGNSIQAGSSTLASFALHKDKHSRAVELVRPMALNLPSSDAYHLGRQVLGKRIPGYHIPIMNNARRNAAWVKALRNAIRPGMHVLEIGTGAGMLALIAARAGAER